MKFNSTSRKRRNYFVSVKDIDIYLLKNCFETKKYSYAYQTILYIFFNDFIVLKTYLWRALHYVVGSQIISWKIIPRSS